MSRNTPKIYSKRTNRMSDNAFADLKIALEDALAYERGERKDLNVTQIQISHPVKTGLRMKASVKRRS